MKGHFYNLKQEYLGWVDLPGDNIRGSLRLPILMPTHSEMAIPLGQDPDPKALVMPYRTFSGCPIYDPRCLDHKPIFMLYLEIPKE